MDFIQNLLESFKSKQHQPSTAKNYHGIWKNFNAFVIRLDHKPVSWEERTAAYGAYLVHKGVQSSTLKSYISAIKHTLLMDDYPWCDEKLKLSIMTNACVTDNDANRTRLPVQNGLLEVLLFQTVRHFDDQGQNYLKLLYKSLFQLLYYGLFRIGELTKGDHPVWASDIHLAANKDKLLIILRSSKTHSKRSKPQEVRVEGNPNLDKTRVNYFCPYISTREFLEARGDYNHPL